MPAQKFLSSLAGNIVIFVVLVGLLFSTVQTFFKIRSRQKDLSFLQVEVGTLEAKTWEMQDELTYRQSRDFIYKEAVEQLGYTRPGEVIVILPDIEQARNSEEDEPQQSAQIALEPLPYWKQWRDLFFGY